MGNEIVEMLIQFEMFLSRIVSRSLLVRFTPLIFDEICSMKH